MRYLFWSDGGRGRTDYDWQRLHMVHSDVYLNPSHRPFAAVYRGVNEMELPCAQSVAVCGTVTACVILSALSPKHPPAKSASS